MKAVRIYIVTLLALFLSGCSAYSLIAPGDAKLGDLSVQTGENWSQISRGGVTVWTRDGVYLNRVSLEKISGGKHILNLKLDKGNAPFAYDAKLSLDDTVELFLDALSTNSFYNVELEDSKPVRISDYPAQLFQYRYDSQDNLTYRVKALFIKRENFLYKLYCAAPVEHYYSIYEPEFERILASASF